LVLDKNEHNMQYSFERNLKCFKEQFYQNFVEKKEVLQHISGKCKFGTATVDLAGVLKLKLRELVCISLTLIDLIFDFRFQGFTPLYLLCNLPCFCYQNLGIVGLRRVQETTLVNHTEADVFVGTNRYR